jgi:hypothetical protein
VTVLVTFTVRVTRVVAAAGPSGTSKTPPPNRRAAITSSVESGVDHVSLRCCQALPVIEFPEVASTLRWDACVRAHVLSILGDSRGPVGLRGG